MIEPVDSSWLWDRVVRPTRSEGVLPDDSRRRFRETRLVDCRGCRGTGSTGSYSGMDNEWSEGWTCPDCACEGKVAEETPVVERLPSAEAALGSDPEGVLKAEAAARECAAAMEPWGAAPVPERVIWRVGGPLSQPMRAAMPHEAGSHIRKLMMHHWGYRSRSGYGPGFSESLRRPGMFLSRAFWHAQLDWLWRVAANEGHVIPASYQYVGEHRPPERVVGLTLADLPNPFAPLVDLWATGYALDKIEPAGIRLIAPY